MRPLDEFVSWTKRPSDVLGRFIPWTIRPQTIYPFFNKCNPSFCECLLNSDRLCSDRFNSDKVQTAFKALNLF